MQRLVFPRMALWASTLSSLSQSHRLYGGRSRNNDGEAPGDKKAKLNLEDDDRWLEAEFDEHNLKAEERYAHERQRQLMKNLLQKMRSEHDEKLQNAVKERNEKVQHLQSAIKELTEKLDDLQKGK